jgi:TonB family protein
MEKFFPAFLMTTLLGLTTPVWAQDKVCKAPDSPLAPVVATRTLPPYPPMAVMTGEGGTSLLEVLIGADGVVISGTVVKSSGSLRLDEAALEHVKATWRWKAPVQNCQPLQASTRVSIQWDLRDAPDTNEPRAPLIVLGKFDYPPGAFSRKEQGDVFINFIVMADGAVKQAQIAKSSGFPELDEKALALVTNWYRWLPATMDGKRINTPLYVAFSWRLDAPPGAPPR